MKHIASEGTVIPSRPKRRFAIIATAAIWLLAAPAFAFTEGQVLTFLKSRNPSCLVTLAKAPMHAGHVSGSSKPVTVVQYEVDSCGGGNNWQREFAALYDSGSGIAAYQCDDQLGQVDQAILAGGMISVQTRDYKPTDPHCCPSVRKSYRFVVSGNKLIDARVHP
jgi:hypothetical protein